MSRNEAPISYGGTWHFTCFDDLIPQAKAMQRREVNRVTVVVLMRLTKGLEPAEEHSKLEGEPQLYKDDKVGHKHNSSKSQKATKNMDIQTINSPPRS
jgi:hypothetical protein